MNCPQNYIESRSTSCCLCGDDIITQANGWSSGHNPWPVVDSRDTTRRACDDCNEIITLVRIYKVDRAKMGGMFAAFGIELENGSAWRDGLLHSNQYSEGWNRK